MNVLFVASDNNYTSGAFLSMVKLNELLRAEKGVETFVVLPNPGDGDVLLEGKGIPYAVIPSRNWIVDIGTEEETRRLEQEKAAELETNEATIQKVQELIRKKSIDLVHINTSYNNVGAIAALREGIPFVWHIREFLEEDQGRKIYDREKGYALMSQATALIATSHSLYEKYRHILPEEKLHIIANGIDASEFDAGTREIFQGEEVRIGIVGGVLRYKGQEELIEACRILKGRGIQGFHLSIIGKCKPAYQAELEERIQQEGLSDIGELAGPSHDVAHAMQGLDILCVCSRREAFGRVTVEGMLSGCLVIGADTAGTVEVLDDGKAGILYHAGNPDDLADHIASALQDPQAMRQLARRGQNYARQTYTAGRNADEVHALYEEVLAAHRRQK